MVVECFLLNKHARDDVKNVSMRRPRVSVREKPKRELCALMLPTTMYSSGN